jgi:hypothetical protein
MEWCWYQNHFFTHSKKHTTATMSSKKTTARQFPITVAADQAAAHAFVCALLKRLVAAAQILASHKGPVQASHIKALAKLQALLSPASATPTKRQNGGEGALGHTVLPPSYFSGRADPDYTLHPAPSTAQPAAGLIRPALQSQRGGWDGAIGHTRLPISFFTPGADQARYTSDASGSSPPPSATIIRQGLPSTLGGGHSVPLDAGNARTWLKVRLGAGAAKFTDGALDALWAVLDSNLKLAARKNKTPGALKRAAATWCIQF